MACFAQSKTFIRTRHDAEVSNMPAYRQCFGIGELHVFLYKVKAFLSVPQRERIVARVVRNSLPYAITVFLVLVVDGVEVDFAQVMEQRNECFGFIVKVFACFRLAH